jgi:hypothetical protein
LSSAFVGRRIAILPKIHQEVVWVTRLQLLPTTTTTTATITITRRPFFSFLFGSGNDNGSASAANQSKALAADDVNAVERRKNEAAATKKVLLDGVLHRMSVQHAHPLGPWQAMLVAVQSHYDKRVFEFELSKVKVKEEEEEEELLRNKGTTSTQTAAMTTLTSCITDEAAITSDHPNKTPCPANATAVPVIDPLLPFTFRVLDLASGPRGEPGTTIAHALPLASVHCTDSCSVAVAAIPIFVKANGDDDGDVDGTTRPTADIETKTSVEDINRQQRRNFERNNVLETSNSEDTTLGLPVMGCRDGPHPPTPPKNLTK